MNKIFGFTINNVICVECVGLFLISEYPQFKNSHLLDFEETACILAIE